MFIFVVPGMIAYAMHNDPLSGFKLPVEDGVVQSSGTLQQWYNTFYLQDKSLIAAGILSALMSSLSSVFNSCSTLIPIFTKNITLISLKNLVKFGQIATVFWYYQV